MIDFLKILKSTTAYKILEGDKKENKLSHAYLLIVQDGVFLKEYLKVIAKIIMCDSGNPCCKCRNCELITNNAHSDVLFYPKGEKGIVTDDITNLLEETFLKPIEGEKKLFVLSNVENMNLQAQNKLLKTLEEPPKNVHLLLGAVSTFSLLPTVMSRVKKIEINALDSELIFDALKDDYPDSEKLKEAISCGDGSLGKAISLYDDEKFLSSLEIAKDMLINMITSRDVLKYSAKLDKEKVDFSEYWSAVSLIFEDMLYIIDKKENLVKNKISIDIYNKSKGFSRGAIVNALEKINEGFKRKNFNANQQMLQEWLLFQILEGKYKWQKL